MLKYIITLIVGYYGLKRLIFILTFRPKLNPYNSLFTSITGNPLSFYKNVPMMEYKQERAKYTLIVSHGQGSDIAKCDLNMATLSRDLGVNLVCYDYQGYGIHGKYRDCSEDACYRDLVNVYSYITSNGVNPKQIILMGISLGSGPTVDVASRMSVGGVILVAPYTSIIRASSVYLGYWLPEILSQIPTIDIFENIKKIHRISAPLYLVHGQKDDVIPIYHGEKLASIAKSHGKLWRERYIPEAKHLNLLSLGREAFVKDLKEFLSVLCTDVNFLKGTR